MCGCVFVALCVCMYQATDVVVNRMKAEYFGLVAATNAVLGITRPRHFAIATNNAGCLRLLSPPYRFGSTDQAIIMFQRARHVHPSPAFALYNLAVRSCDGDLHVLPRD